MGLIPNPNTMKSMGIGRLWNGLRTGDQRSVLAGAGLFAISWLRRTRAPKKTLIHRSTVPDGSSLVIRSGPAGEMPDVTVIRAEPPSAT